MLPSPSSQLEHSRYGACEGDPALMSALRTKLASENGHDMHARDVMVTNGANQAYVSALLTLCDPGDEVRQRFCLLLCPRAPYLTPPGDRIVCTGRPLSALLL